jgi:glycerol-3-phosphate dehydrogenase
MLRPEAVHEAEPQLRREGLRGAGLYFDYRTDDARLVLETMLAATEEGAVVASYADVVGFVKEGGRIVGARVADRFGGGEVEVRARVVVNASGPWVDAVAALDAPGPARLRLTKGVHVIVPRERIGHRVAVVLSALADGRVMFVIPWGAHSLVGTTDTDHVGGPDTPPTVERADVDYLLETVNHYFPAARLGTADVVSAFAGLRPLVAPPAVVAASPSAVSREEDIFVSDAGLITIAGGKLTTYRLIAGAVVDRVTGALRRAGDRRRFPRSRTGCVPLPGGKASPEVVAAEAVSRDGHGMAPAVIGHLANRYGSRLGEVLGLVARDRALASPIVPTLPDPRAEVVEAVEREWALTLEDVLRRRTQIALRDGSCGAAVATDVADLMAARLGWDEADARASAERYVEAVEARRRRWQ